MDPRRRIWRATIVLVIWIAVSLPGGAPAEEPPARVIEARIAQRQVVAPPEALEGAIRITQGQVIELRWTSDEAVELHLHGYDIELRVTPDAPAAMTVEAFAAGRFPITSHGWGEAGHGHHALTYLEVYPD